MDAVLVIGAPGSGKSSVAAALATQLVRDGIRYGGIETDQLSWGWPWLTLAQWLPQLQALVGLQREAGRRLLLVVATPESPGELRAVLDALAAERSLVVCLRAPAAVLAERVADREPDSWPGKAALVEHARELADVIPRLPGVDCVVSTEPPGSAAEVAAEVRELMLRTFEPNSGLEHQPSRRDRRGDGELADGPG